MKRPRGSGSLRLVDGVWQARYYHRGRRVEESTGYGAADRAKAETFLRAKVKAADTPAFVEPAARKLAVDDLLDIVRREHARKGNRSRLKLGHLVEHFSGASALAVTSEDVACYADARIAAGAQPATVNRELAALRRGFRLAMAKRLLPTMPQITLRSEAGNVREGFLEVGDLDPLLAELRQRDPVVADAVETAFVTLLRRSNLLTLTWAMFALDVQGGHVCGGELRLPGTKTKNKRPLALPLTGCFLAVIDRRWQARREDCPYVFHRAGRPVLRFDETWRDATAAAGHAGLFLHDLRRSGARALLRAGVPEDVVMKLGGWRTRSMLTRYNVVSSDDLAAAQERLTQAFATAAPRRVVPLRRPPRG